MASRKGDNSKAIDQSTDWSAWVWDEPNSQYYRTRHDANGLLLYDYDLRPVVTAAKKTPRGDTRYANDTTATDSVYYTNDIYGYDTKSESVEPLSNQFQQTALSYTTRPAVAHSSSCHDTPPSSDLPSQGSDFFGYGETQPIDMPASPARSRPAEHQYSASAPARGYGGLQDNSKTSTLGFLPEEVAGVKSSVERATYSDYQLAQSPSTTSYTSTSTGSPPSANYASLNTGALQQTDSVDPGGSSAITPYKIIKGDQENQKPLDPKFKINPSKHFKPGHVFKILWSEPGGEKLSDATEVTGTMFGQTVHSTIRRFVIVAADHGHCQCLPILTYHQQGTKKGGVNPDDHAIIYVGERPPSPIAGEKPLNRPPIKMNPKSARDKLEKTSRINYAKIYTVEHNVKVLFIGKIAKESERRFMKDFDDTWNKKRQITTGFYE